MTFSIIVVCLNAGEKLYKTIESILRQTEKDYEIIVKDGGSTDGSLEKLLQNGKVKLYQQKDTGIYDAMNQAVKYAGGEYLFFLNCGDYFYDETVLAAVKKSIETGEGMKEKTLKQKRGDIFYGNIREAKTGAVVQSNPVIDEFACYRNVPCHQACFYGRELFARRGFKTCYKVRADYEHFLWCVYEGKARTVYMPITVALYEGGGFSETRENERVSKQEHAKIIKQYMSPAKALKYRLILFLTLAGVRKKLAKNPKTAEIYNRMKRVLYRHNGTREKS